MSQFSRRISALAVASLTALSFSSALRRLP